jgi:hypothetical protein
MVEYAPKTCLAGRMNMHAEFFAKTKMDLLRTTLISQRLSYCSGESFSAASPRKLTAMMPNPLSPNAASTSRVGLSPEVQLLSIASPEESKNNDRTSKNSNSHRARQDRDPSSGIGNVPIDATVLGNSPRVEQECQEHQPGVNDCDDTFLLVNPENNLVSNHMGMVLSAFRPRPLRSGTPLGPPLHHDRCHRPRQDSPKRAKYYYVDVTTETDRIPRFPSFEAVSDDEDEDEIGSPISLEMKPVDPNFDFFSDTPLTPLWAQDGHQRSTPPAQIQSPSVLQSAVLTQSTASPSTPIAPFSDGHSNNSVVRDTISEWEHHEEGPSPCSFE